MRLNTCRIFPRRFSSRNAFTFLVLFVILITLLSIAGRSSIDNDEEWYKHPDAYFSEVTCQHDDYTLKLFAELTRRLSQVFEKLEMKYFLCYGSLWGALKFKQVLPWDRNIDLCIIHHQLMAVDEEHLYETFKKLGLRHSYNSRRGKYVVTYKTVTAEVTVFEKVGSHMERVGWEKRFFPHLYYNYQTFPYQLVDHELKRLPFNGVDMPVPHQEYELQKYLYPENWWNEVKPKGCY